MRRYCGKGLLILWQLESKVEGTVVAMGTRLEE